jgi:hypothetical protein
MSIKSTTDPLRAVDSDAGLGFERAMAAALQKATAAYSLSADRIIAGTWSESELCHLHTPEWIKPNQNNFPDSHDKTGTISRRNAGL